MITDPLFYLAAIPAVILLGLSKGGFAGLGNLSLPLIALVISPVQAAAIMLPILIVQDAVGVVAYRSQWSGRNLAILLPSACVGIGAAYFFAAYVSEAAMSLALGVISVIFGLRQLVLERRGIVTAVSPGLVPGLLCGWAAGFTSAVAHAGGPPFQIYVLPQRLPRDIMVGTGVIFFAVVNIVKVPPYFALGQFTAENLATAGALLPLAIASTIAGVALVRRVSADRFYPLIYGLLVLVGLKLLWDGAHGLW